MKKTKRIFAILLSAIMTVSVTSAFSVGAATLENHITPISYDDYSTNEIETKDYRYVILDDGTIEITYYLGNEHELTIPSTLDGKKVTVIGDSAFAWRGLNKVIIPEGITTIKYYAFSHNGMQKVTFPNSLRYIGEDAFSVNNIENITFPSDIEYVEGDAFFDNTWEYNLPDGFTIIGKCLYLFKDSTYSVKDVVVPDGIVSISSGAFCQNGMIENVVLPNSLREIGDYAFGYCKNLSNISFQNSIKTIGRYAFYNTNWFEQQNDGLVYIKNILYAYKGEMPENYELKIPDNTISITPNAFGAWSNLTSVIVPGSISEITPYSFSGCSLTKVVICEGVKKIDAMSFESSQFLTEVTIPNSVTKIEEDSFYRFEKKLKVYGYQNSAAEDFAINNDLNFIPIGTYFELSDNKSSIKVSSIMSEIPELVVTNLNNTAKNSISTYNIDFQKNGSSINPLNRVNISIPCDNANCFVAYVKSNGKIEKTMDANYLDGYYNFTTNEVGNFAIIKKNITGDVSKDGIVDVNDVTLLQMHIATQTFSDGADIINENDTDLINSIDMNGDTVLDVIDVTALQFYIIQNSTI